MEEQFELPVEYKGEPHVFNAKLIVTGYTYRFNVEVNGQTIIFEPDEERNYRAIIPYDDIDDKISIDKELVKAITTTIEKIVK